MRAVIYARYSSDQQRDASIDDQLRVCRVRAEREGWSVAETFTDHAISGTTLLRPGYQALLAHLRGPGIVLAESLDRFSRDQEHIAAFYKQASFARARIFTLAGGEVSELHVGLKGTMGALYLKDLAAKTHRGLEGRIRAGRCVGTPPYGYRMVRRTAQNGEPEHGLREIDEAQATVVRRIFTAYAAGSSPPSIARTLNDEGVAGPGAGRRGGAFRTFLGASPSTPPAHQQGDLWRVRADLLSHRQRLSGVLCRDPARLRQHRPSSPVPPRGTSAGCVGAPAHATRSDRSVY
jgi:DNA invertase Pin-like site-specific DNA recombinase